MLGKAIEDPARDRILHALRRGLDLLPLVTHFGREKRTAQVRARIAQPSLLGGEADAGVEVTGYEIHMGIIERATGVAAPFKIIARNGLAEDVLDGAISPNGTIIGTMLHGIFENDGLARRPDPQRSPSERESTAPLGPRVRRANRNTIGWQKRCARI